MLRFLLLAASFLSAAPAYWTQKSVGSNPVAPFTLARTDTIIARQIHDTADTLRKYTRDRIKDSLVGIRAALPAASTLQAAYGASTAPQITTSTAKGSLTIRRGTASDTNAVIAVQNGAGTVTSRLNGDGSFAGTRTVLTATADAPVTISHNLAGAFTHPFQAFNSGMVAGNQYNFDFGQSASTNNAGNFGFKYVGAGSASNYVTLGLYGANDLLTITAAGVPKFSGLATAGFVRANASGQLSSSPPTYADLTGTVPTWNQSTTGNAATATKWATARTLTIGATGKAIDGTGNQSWSLAEIGALASGGTAVNSSALGGVNSAYFVQGTGAGDYGHRTTSIELTPPDNLLSSGFYDGRMSMPSGGFWTHLIRSAHSDPTNAKGRWSFDIAANFAGSVGNGENYFVRTNTDVSWGTWRTLWHSGNLTNLNQLTNGPGYITSAGSISGNAATATKWATARTVSATGDASWSVSLDGSANVSAALTLASVITAGSAGSASQVPVVTWDAKGRLTAVSSATITPAAIGAASASSLAGYLPIAAGSTHSPGSYSATAATLGIGDGQYGLSANGSILYLWAPSAGQVTSSRNFVGLGSITAATTLAWGGAAAITSSDYVVQGNGAGLYGHRTTNITSSPDQLLPSGFYDGAVVGMPTGTWTHMIRSSFSSLAGTSTKWSFDIAANFAGGVSNGENYYVRTNTDAGWGTWRTLWHSGNLTSATLPGGPYLPLAGGTVTGYTNFANDIGTQRQFVGNGDIFVRAGAVLLRTGDGNDWADAAVQFPSTSTVQSFRVDGGAQFNSAVRFTAGAVHGASKQIATHLYSTSSTLPALAQGEWCWVVMDQSGGGSAYWSAPSTRSLRYYAGGTTTTLVPASTQMVVPNNGTAWILYGPAYSGTTQMTLVM